MAASDLELGPCQVLWGVEDSEADLGKTEGGVVVHFSTNVADLASDQGGTAPEDQTITGQKVTIDVPLAEITFDNLALGLNQTKKVYSGKYGVPGANIVGTSLLEDKAQSLVLVKYEGGIPSVDTEDRFKFAKAAPTGNFDFGFNKSGQRIIMVVFTAFTDTEGLLYRIGDDDACISGS